MASTNHLTMDSTPVPKIPLEEAGSRQPQPQNSAATPEAPAAPPPGEQPVPLRQPQLALPDVLPPSKVTGEFNVLCYSLLSLFIVSFGVWLAFAWTNYGTRYAPNAEGWYKGGTRSIELTLIREDVQNLGCASDVVSGGLHCANRADQQPFDANVDPKGTDDRVILRPYNTVDSVLFLGAGLWSSPALAGPLPKDRFTVVCNFHMVGTVKPVLLRWAPSGPFGPVKDALPAGVLTDCVIPQ